MSGTGFESDELQFCPICQVPSRLLKIVFTVHISMCDILWDELPDCSHGVECQNESVFHYRDFSHKVLADHRENLRKRKIEDTNSLNDAGNIESKSKEKVRRVAEHREFDENEENVFVSPDFKRVSSGRNRSPKTKLTRRSAKKKNSKTECAPGKEEIEDVILNICRSIKPEQETIRVEESCTSTSMENAGNNEETIDSIGDGVSVQSITEDENRTDPMIIEDKFDSCIADESSSSWEHLSKKIDENVERKEKCKVQWNNLFKKDSKSVTDLNSSETNKKKRKSMFSSAKEVRVCPSFKKMPGTSFAVDAFQFGNIPGITAYFLSHFHSDHYIGLRKSFANPIYCSLITANLVKKKLRVAEKYLHVLELHEPVVISQVEVTCFDANHCPGAVIFLFRLMNGEQFLHVGDFRACPEMENIPELQNCHIDRLYLDTTYFNPNYVFPTQTEVVERVKKIVRNKITKHEKALFISGTYLIGKEKVFIAMLEELQCKLWAQRQKLDVFQCVNDPVILSSLTSVPTDARVHVLPMNYLRVDRLKKHLLDQNGAFTHIFAFKPTGWEMGRRAGSGDWINESTYSNITIYGVPYSEHSNYEELCRFVRFIKADKVIPTVPMKNRQMYGLLKSIVDSYKGGPKQQGIQQFLSTSS